MKVWPLLALLLLQTTPEPPKRKGTVEGVVTRLGTGQPVGGVRVTLTRIGDSQSGEVTPDLRIPGLPGGVQSAGTPIPPVLTDDRGRFTIQTEEGVYAVQVQGNGYVAQLYGKRFADDPGTPVTVTGGQTTRDVNVTLTPAATISGSIRDEFDRPLVNVPVQLLHYSYNDEGERAYATGSAVQTDDRGEYRMYWVTPGRYYVLAGRPATTADPMLEMMTLVLGGGAAGNRVPATKGYAFYPGVTDIQNARAIDLQPGTELQAIDTTLAAKPRTYTIRGRLIDSKTGQTPAQANVIVVPQTPGLSGDGMEFRLTLPNRNYNGQTGRIEIRDLLPGVYSVMAVVQDPLATSRRGVPNQSSGALTVSVSSADIEDIVLAIAPAGSIEGRLRVEGPLPAGVKIDQMLVRLQPTGANSAAQRTMQFQLESASGFYDSGAGQARADGTFRMNNIPPGDYRLEVTTGIFRRLGGQGYIKEARFEGSDVLGSPLRFSGSGSLDIVIAMGGGKLDGVVTDARSQPVAGAQVVLVPDRARFRSDLYHTIRTDRSGRFSLAPVAPGDYKVFAWESIEEFSWFDPDVLTRYESRSRTAHVAETSNETIDVRIIPTEGAR